jgi:uncharacterized protein with GYD domain
MPAGGFAMSKYLLEVSYTATGAKGLLKEGGSSRRTAVEKMLKESGGKLEAFYYAFGDRDAFCIIDVPDAATVTALSLAVSGAGAAKVNTIVLISPEEVDKAAKKSIEYRAPGA